MLQLGVPMEGMYTNFMRNRVERFLRPLLSRRSTSRPSGGKRSATTAPSTTAARKHRDLGAQGGERKRKLLTEFWNDDLPLPCKSASRQGTVRALPVRKTPNSVELPSLENKGLQLPRLHPLQNVCLRRCEGKGMADVQHRHSMTEERNRVHYVYIAG